MKALIFDVDNTLIDWKNEYIFALKSVLKEMGYDSSDEMVLKIDSYIEVYENHITHLSKEKLLEFINEKCNLDLPIEFINKLIIAQGDCYTYDEELVKTIEYLSKKYDLFVISNWFTDTQKLRLENMGIAKYFKKIIGSDTNYSKPDNRVFDIILSEYNKEDIVYIGDNLELDIKFPNSLGIKTIWKTSKDSSEYTTIKKVSDLINIL